MLEGDRLIRIAEVCDIVGLGKTMIYRMVRDGRFPRPYKPGGASTRWSLAEVRAWVEEVKRRRSD